MVTLKIKNKIEIRNAPESLLNVIKKTLSLPNPLYYRLLRMGNTRALYATPEYFKYYTEHDDVMYIGRGMEERLIAYLDKNNIAYEKKDETVAPCIKDGEIVNGIVEREYQNGVIETIERYNRGIIRLGTGFGKSLMALGLIAETKRATCILVPRVHLAEQFAQECRQWLNYQPGIIQGDKETIKDITIASIQTLVRRPSILSRIQDRFGQVIVDECHTAIAKKRLPIVQSFNAKYIFAMTATAKRTDEQGEALHFTFGPIIIDKDMDSHTPTVEILKTDMDIPVREYPDMVATQVNHPIRNQLIVQAILNEAQSGRRILVLTKRIEHYERLHELLLLKNPLLVIHSISSGTGQHERIQLLSDLREGKSDFDVLLGTYSLLATGTDIPVLSTVIFAGDLKSSVLQAQAGGRVMRIFEGKQNPKIIDVADFGNGIFLHQFKERRKWYRKWGWL